MLYKVTMTQSRQLSREIEAPGAAELSDLLIADNNELCQANGWIIDPYSVEEAILGVEEVIPNMELGDEA